MSPGSRVLPQRRLHRGIKSDRYGNGTSKAIVVTPQVRERLGIDAGIESLTPMELIKAMLRAPVDLLFNGGIGTYVKARTESHADAGDKTNDALRARIAMQSRK